jgi:hypothetical protein
LNDKANTFATGQNSYEGLTGWINAQQAQYDDSIHNKILKSSNEKSATDKTTEKPKGFNWLNTLLIGGLGFLGGRLIR